MNLDDERAHKIYQTVLFISAIIIIASAAIAAILFTIKPKWILQILF